jgi:hypothetical protein
LAYIGIHRYATVVIGSKSAKIHRDTSGYIGIHRSMYLCNFPQCTPVETVRHFLTSCPVLLGAYTFRHDNIVKLLAARMVELGLQIVNSCKHDIRDAGLAPALAWLGVGLHYKPDLVAYDSINNVAWVVEVTVCWEDSYHERVAGKTERYEDVCAVLSDAGWTVHMLPVVVGARASIHQRLAAALRTPRTKTGPGLGFGKLVADGLLGDIVRGVIEDTVWLWSVRADPIEARKYRVARDAAPSAKV